MPIKYHIHMSSDSSQRKSRKSTLLATHPRFTSTLANIILTEFRSIRIFAELAGVHPTYFYTYLRDEKKGVIPRFDVATNLMRTVKKHAPNRFESLMEALRRDIETDLGSTAESLPPKRGQLPPICGFTEEELELIFLRAGWKIPRPSIARRFRVEKN